MKTQSVAVGEREKACLNCEHYRLYYTRGDGKVWAWVPTCHGVCLKNWQQRGPLRHPCKEFKHIETQQIF